MNLEVANLKHGCLGAAKLQTEKQTIVNPDPSAKREHCNNLNVVCYGNRIFYHEQFYIYNAMALGYIKYGTFNSTVNKQ